MQELLQDPLPDANWEKLRPVLDQAMHELKEADRAVILMRYFENHSFADIGQKLAGTFSSTGTRAYVLDATRAVHGDLGMLHPEDVVLILSHSGESDEIVRLLPPLRPLIRSVIALTGNATGTLARKADVAIVYGPLDEVCPLGLAPSASTTAMLALGDALAFVLSREREFTAEDFARYHPAGAIGRALLVQVRDIMRTRERNAIAAQSVSVKEALLAMTRAKSGCLSIVNAAGKLTGAPVKM